MLNQIKSLTVLSDLAAVAFFFNSVMMECLGLISNDLLGLVTKNFLHQLGERLEISFALLKFFFLGARLQFLAIELLELLDDIPINRITKKGEEDTSCNALNVI